jgi:hypothetical protein
MYSKAFCLVCFLGLIAMGCGENHGSEDSSTSTKFLPVVGRWDVSVEDPGGVYPSWFEIQEEGGELRGRFVGRVGSTRPVTDIRFDGEQLRFTLPPQYERQKDDLLFIGRVSEQEIVGETFSEDGQNIRFTAQQAPALDSNAAPEWGEPIHLIGDDLSNWTLRNPEGPRGWTIKDGVLTNTPPSVDLITKSTFGDFELHVEFNMPPDSNSGVYLRGRYEIQIQDDYGQEPDSRRCGGIYGFIAPTKMAAKPAGEWNTYDITLIGRRVTVVLNDDTIIDGAEIPGITGGALDSREGELGPLMLQGDHRAIQYRNVVLTRARPRKE